VSERFQKRFGPPRRADEPITEFHEDVAFGLQAVVEEAALNLAREAAIQCGRGIGLCLGGGVALNSVMNARLLTDGPFRDVYIPAPCGDAGNAIGGALLAWHEETGKPRGWQRSEEHTSELQSPYDLVCRLLLEKKNKSRIA